MTALAAIPVAAAMVTRTCKKGVPLPAVVTGPAVGGLAASGPVL